jgi:hypothetical protein
MSEAKTANLSKHASGFQFTRLYAHIVEEDGAFTVRIRVINHLNREQRAWGEEIAETIEMAGTMISSIADQFSIPQQGISIKIVMGRHKDGTFH